MKRVNQTVVPVARPSPYEVYLALKTTGFNIHSYEGEIIVYEPYGLPGEVLIISDSLLFSVCIRV